MRKELRFVTNVLLEVSRQRTTRNPAIRVPRENGVHLRRKVSVVVVVLFDMIVVVVFYIVAVEDCYIVGGGGCFCRKMVSISEER